MLRSDEMKSGGLALDGATVEVLDASWTLDAPPNYSVMNGTPLFVLVQFKDTGTGEAHEQHFPCGNLGTTCEPNQNNPRTLDVPDGGVQIVKSTNFAIFITSCYEKGLVQPAAGGTDLSFLVGAVMILERKAVERAGLAMANNSKSDGKVYVCQKLVKKPGAPTNGAPAKAPVKAGAADSAKAKPALVKPAAAPAAAAAAPTASAAVAQTGITLSGETGADLEAYILAAIASGESVAINALRPQLMKLMLADKATLPATTRSALLGLLGNPAQLEIVAQEWTGVVYDQQGGTVTAV